MMMVPIYRNKWEYCPVLIISWQLFSLFFYLRRRYTFYFNHSLIQSYKQSFYFLLLFEDASLEYCKIKVYCHFIAKYIIINFSDREFIRAILFTCLFICISVVSIQYERLFAFVGNVLFIWLLHIYISLSSCLLLFIILHTNIHYN